MRRVVGLVENRCVSGMKGISVDEQGGISWNGPELAKVQ